MLWFHGVLAFILKKKLQQSNNLCPICQMYVDAKDLVDLNYIYTETKKKGKFFAHKNCYKYRRKVKK